LLDADCERLVFRIRAHHDGAILAASDDHLDELIDSAWIHRRNSLVRAGRSTRKPF
jgi:hypothetical protein